MKIGLMGLNFCSKNFGCAALAYSFLNILFESIDKTGVELSLTFYDSVKNSLKGLPLVSHPRAEIAVFKYDKHNIRAFYNHIKQEDVFFDFTAGDSFSDYYGLSRFVKRTFNKTLVLVNKKKLVLGPQTYGPYKSFIARKWAGYIIERSSAVFARDGMSQERAQKLCKKQNVQLVTDVAFALPYDKSRYAEQFQSGKTKIGLNFSGLLYTGGYTGNNQFGLTVDYKKYCCEVLDYLTQSKKYDIWLIPHAISRKIGFNDNDLIASDDLSKKYDVNVAPEFENPMDAKSFIANMDLFSGARMHATIGAFSSGVVTIPFSYSVKFEGLYGELEYPYCIHGKEDSTEIAVQKTIEYIEKKEDLRNAQIKSLALAQERLNTFKESVQKFILDFN